MSAIRQFMKWLPHPSIQLAVIVMLWGLLTIWGIGWGLPNLHSFSADSIPLSYGSDARQMLAANTYKYPPLAYLMMNAAAPPAEGAQPPDLQARLEIHTHRLLRFRLVSAIMALLVALTLYAGTLCLLGWRHANWLPPVLFLTSPLTLRFAFTTNVDMITLGWATLSLLCFGWAELRGRQQENRTVLIVGSALFGLTMGAAFGSKDQIYAAYLLPLIIYCLWVAIGHRQWKNALLMGTIWTVAFAAVLSVVYGLVGGWPIFRLHFQWITTAGVDEWREVGSDFGGRARLLLIDLGRLFLAWDWALTLIAAVSTVAAWRQADQTQRRRLAVYWLVFAIIFIGFELAFSQVVRYSRARYYLFTIVGAALLVGLAIELLHRQKRHRALTAVFGVLLICHLCLGVQFLVQRANDTRMRMRHYLAESAIGPPDAPVAITGKEMEYTYLLNDGRQIPLRDIRNWGPSLIGVVAMNYYAIMDDPLYIALTQPPVVVALASQVDTFLAAGYSQNLVMAPEPGWLWQFNSHQQPTLHLLSKAAAPPQPYESLRPLGQQVLILQDAYDSGWADLQLIAFGATCPKWDQQALKGHNIRPEAILLLAQAYDLNDRTESANAALDFVLQFAPSEQAEALQKAFNARHGDPDKGD